jgi:hypothetical protein
LFVYSEFWLLRLIPEGGISVPTLLSGQSKTVLK